MNPYTPGTREHADWQFGYDNEPWTAPADNASAAMWRGYHQAARTRINGYNVEFLGAQPARAGEDY
jgi:hypothetical protein